MTWNPYPFPAIRSPSLLPVTGNPCAIVLLIIIWWKIVIRRGIPSVIDRGSYPDDGWRDIDPRRSAMGIWVSMPGQSHTCRG